MSLKFLLGTLLLLACGVTLALFLWPSGIGHATDSWVYSVAFSPDSQILASAAGGRDHNQIRLWDMESGRQLKRLVGYANHPYAVAFSRAGKVLASGGRENNIRLWNVGSGQEIGKLMGHNHYVNSLAFHPNGWLLASGSDDKSIRLWNMQTAKQVSTLGDGELPVRCVTFSPDGTTLAAADADKSIYLFDIKTGGEVRRLHGHMFRVEWVGFSPIDGAILASAGFDHTMRLWDWKNGHAKEQFATGGLGLGAWSPDGKALACDAPDYNVQIIDLRSGKVTARFQGPERIKCLCWSPDGQLLGMGGMDGAAMVIEVATGKSRF